MRGESTDAVQSIVRLFGVLLLFGLLLTSIALVLSPTSMRDGRADVCPVQCLGVAGIRWEDGPIDPIGLVPF